MKDVRVAQVAGRQFNRISRRQLSELGLSDQAIAHRVARGRLAVVEHGVFAVAPVLSDDPWGRWMAATLTAPETFLSHGSGGSAWGFWDAEAEIETVSRPGSGGPRQHGRLLIFRSRTLEGDCELLRGVPITSTVRT
jgi:hypothetical protein